MHLPAHQKNLRILVTLSALAGLIYAVNLFNSPAQLPKTSEVRCDLNQQNCELIVGGRKVSLSLSPTPARSLTPLTFTARFEGRQPEKLWLDIQGDEMYMGLNQPQMTRSDNQWTATTELSVCTTGKMLWRATLVVVDADQEYQLPFYFEAQ